MTCAIVCTKQFRWLKWVGKRLANIFEGGWVDTSFKARPRTSRRSSLKFPSKTTFTSSSTNCKDTAVSLVHDLKLKACGLRKAWVILDEEN